MANEAMVWDDLFTRGIDLSQYTNLLPVIYHFLGTFTSVVCDQGRRQNLRLKTVFYVCAGVVYFAKLPVTKHERSERGDDVLQLRLHLDRPSYASCPRPEGKLLLFGYWPEGGVVHLSPNVLRRCRREFSVRPNSLLIDTFFEKRNSKS